MNVSSVVSRISSTISVHVDVFIETHIYSTVSPVNTQIVKICFLMRLSLYFIIKGCVNNLHAVQVNAFLVYVETISPFY